MRIGGYHSHKRGKEFIEENFPAELQEVERAILQVVATDVLTKQSHEKSKPALCFSPEALNKKIKDYLHPHGWTELAPRSKKGFREPRINLANGNEFREMDGIKNKVGLEIQFGKYAFMGYDIFSKMPIFAKRGLIVCGIEVVVMPSMIRHMSTGVSSFSQVVMDVNARGIADIDIPTLIIGIECDEREWKDVEKKREAFKRDPKGMIARGEVSGGRKGAKPGPK